MTTGRQRFVAVQAALAILWIGVG
ncbi:hypothetical protein LCGC14_2887330, partial [marine sediment metagenome]